MKTTRLVNRLILISALIFGFTTSPAARDDDDKAADDEEVVEEEVEEDSDEQESAEGADEDGVIPVENVELIKKNLKKAVIVHGTIAEAKIFKTSGHALLKFEEADVAIFVHKENLEKNKTWDITKLEGLGVYVAGQVKIYRDQLEVVIVGPDQIAVTPDGFDLAKIPLPETDKKSSSSSKKKVAKVEGAIAPTKKDYPDLPLKLTETSVQTVAFYVIDTGMKIKDDPYGLPIDRLDATVAAVSAVVKEVEGGGPMQVAFPKPNKDSKDQIKALLDQLAESYDGRWPKDKLLTIDVDFDSREFKDDPSTLVIAALIHSLVTGKELTSNLVISADVESDGTLVGAGRNADGEVSNNMILRSISENSGEPVRYICADMSTDELNDLALDGEWETLSNVVVLAAPSLKDGLKLIFAEPESDLGKALAAFDEAQAVINTSGASMVKNSHVQQRVITAGKAWPKNKSAVFYLYYGRGKVPRTYSLPYTHNVIGKIHTQLRFLQISKPADPKLKFRKQADTIKAMRSKLDPELGELIRAISDFEDEASASVTRPREGRAKERQDEKIKAADTAVTEGLSALTTRIGGGGEAEDE